MTAATTSTPGMLRRLGRGRWREGTTAPAPEALTLQRPMSADALRIVARGEKEDEAPLAFV
jgi:hypothetical protein